MAGIQGPLEGPQPPNQLAMSALTSLSVHDNEVLVIIATNPTGALKAYTISDIHDLENVEASSLGDSFRAPLGMTNPRNDHKQSSDCIALPAAGSH
jgi:hypothetical protein